MPAAKVPSRRRLRGDGLPARADDSNPRPPPGQRLRRPSVSPCSAARALRALPSCTAWSMHQSMHRLIDSRRGACRCLGRHSRPCCGGACLVSVRCARRCETARQVSCARDQLAVAGCESLTLQGLQPCGPCLLFPRDFVGRLFWRDGRLEIRNRWAAPAPLSDRRSACAVCAAVAEKRATAGRAVRSGRRLSHSSNVNVRAVRRPPFDHVQPSTKQTTQSS